MTTLNFEFTANARTVFYSAAREEPAKVILIRSLAIIAAFTFATAWVSELYFWPDEHWQVLEFLSFKLGITPAQELPWEYRDHVRSWMQPFLYWLIAKPLAMAHIRDMFVVVWILRMATGALCFAALYQFARFFQADLTREDEQRVYAKALPFMGFLPYLSVRTASETAAMAFFMLGLVAAVKAARNHQGRGFLISGMLCGLAFETRFQASFLVLGLGLWLLVIMRSRLVHLCSFVAGGFAIVAAGVLIDRWGYGVWTFPFWHYFDIVLWNGGASSGSGTSPFFAYFYLLPANIFAPIALFTLIALVIGCLRNPKHYLVWPVAMFLFAHFFLFLHKEERFLFPLAIIATAFPVLAFSPSPERSFAVFGRAWNWRRSIAAKIVGWSAVMAMLLCAIYPFGIRPHMPMAKYIYRHYPDGISAYTFEDAVYQDYPIYRPANYHSARLESRDALLALLKEKPVYLFAETPTLAPGLLPQGVRAELLYSEFPFAMSRTLAPYGTRWICGYAYWRKHGFIHPPRLAWMSLYRLTRTGPNTAAVSPCQPKWNVAL